MNLKFISAGFAAALALGTGSLVAEAAPFATGPAAVQSGGSLVLKTDYDGEGRRGGWWRYHRFEGRGYDEGRGRWWRHRRFGESHRRYWRDRDARFDRHDYRWR